MFSSDKLLHLVFASDQDTYYCNELLTPDLHKYLWLKLHERGYGCVYLLETENGALWVKGYGDKLAEPFAPKKSKWHFPMLSSKKTELQLWMVRQLTAKDPRRSALICSMKDFCEYFQAASWQPLLQELRTLDKRTGILILTAPPEAEGSLGNLLHSPVFEQLGERAIVELRGAGLCNLYKALHESMGGRMLFLNAFTSERVHAMVTRLLLESLDKTGDSGLQPELEAYLLQWMNNKRFRQLESQAGVRLPAPEQSFRNVFAALREAGAWKRLRTQAERVAKAGSIEDYAAGLDCSLVEDPACQMLIRRASDSFASRCVKLDLKDAIRENSPETESILSLQEEIHELAAEVRNREENRHLIAAVNKFLSEIPSTSQGKDMGTLRRLLFSIRFCLQWICIPESSEEETSILSIVELLYNYVACSGQYYQRVRNLALASAHRGLESKTMTVVTENQRREVETARRLLSNYEDVVRAQVYNFSPASSADAISHLAKTLTKELDEMRQAQELSQQEPENQPEPVPAEPAGDDSWMEEEYELTEADEVFIPFLHN